MVASSAAVICSPVNSGHAAVTATVIARRRHGAQ
jgi:hypothetical protein